MIKKEIIKDALSKCNETLINEVIKNYPKLSTEKDNLLEIHDFILDECADTIKERLIDNIRLMCYKVDIDNLNDVTSLTDYIIYNEKVVDGLSMDMLVAFISVKPFTHLFTVNLIHHIKYIVISKIRETPGYYTTRRLEKLIKLALRLYKLNSDYISQNYYNNLIMTRQYLQHCSMRNMFGVPDESYNITKTLYDEKEYITRCQGDFLI